MDHHADSELIPDDPNQGCFLCDPEAWRVVFTGLRVRVVAGIGPLCPGYVLVAPKDHIATSADLDDQTFREFLIVCDLVKDVLAEQYGEGFTAYEHAKIGSCRVAEDRGDTRHFCFHCHRVFIPKQLDVLAAAGRYFEERIEIRQPTEIRARAGTPYVFIEFGTASQTLASIALVREHGVQSQFMRRLLAPILGPGIDYSWATDHRLPTVVETVASMRSAFVALGGVRPVQARFPERTLRRSVSIDGLTATGKTTLGGTLRDTYGCPLVDSGLVIRRLAAARLGASEPTDTELCELVVGIGSQQLPRGPEFSQLVRDVARESVARKRMADAVSAVVARSGPCIVLGRSAWQMVPRDATRIVTSADFPTRLRRRFYDQARSSQIVPAMSDIASALRLADEFDNALLPPVADGAIARIETSRRPAEVVLAEVLSRLGTE